MKFWKFYVSITHPTVRSQRRSFAWLRRGLASVGTSAPQKRVQFDRPLTPWLFLAPQLAVIVIFFYWPSVEAVVSSFYIEDPFGFGATFVGLENYTDALTNERYQATTAFTAFFCVVVTAFSLGTGLFLAVKADNVIRGSGPYQTVLISVWKRIPYDFIFCWTGLRAVPVLVREAALIDARSG